MNTQIFRCNPWLFLWLCFFIFSGCFPRSQQAQFYILSPMPRPDGVIVHKLQFTVSVGTVILPDILKRPQVAVRSGDNEVIFSEFHKWAGMLKDDTKRVLAEDLSILLASNGATVLTDDILIEPDYRVVVNINRFDGQPEHDVWLNAVWTVSDQKNQKSIAINQSVLQEKVSGQNYSDMVNAQSRVLEALAKQIASEIVKQRNSVIMSE